MSRTKNIVRKSFKVLLFVFIGMLVLTVSLWIYLNTSAGKRMLRDQVQSYLQKKLKTKVSIGEVDYDIPDWLKINKLYVEDLKKDTLIYGEEVYVKLSMLKLINSEVEINKIDLNNFYANISRPKSDTSFNYQFIIDAFSDGTTPDEKEKSSDLKITPGILSLKKIRLNFNDEYGGTLMNAAVDSLIVNTYSFDINKPSLVINDIAGKGIRYNMITQKPVAETVADESEDPADFLLQIKKIALEDIVVAIGDSVEKFATKNKIDRIGISGISLDVKNNSTAIDEVEINAADILFAQSKMPKKLSAEKKDTAQSNLRVTVNKFSVNNTSLRYNDYNNKPVKGFDPNHVDMSQVNVAINNILLSPDTTAALLKQLTLKDKSGFSLDTAHADFIMTKNRIGVNNLYVKTPNSLLQRSLDLRYDNLDDLLNKPKNTLITLVPGKSVIAFKDLYLLYPELDKTLPKSSFAKESFVLNGEIKGDFTRLYIPSFEVSGFSGSKLAAKGTLYNITNPKKLSYDLSINEAKFYKKDILKFAPKENHADLKDLPEVILLKGKLKGNANDLVADIGLSGKGFSFLGKIDLKNISNPSKLSYAVNTKNIAVDKSMLLPYIPKDVLSNLYIPDKLNLSGKLGGNINDIQSDLSLKSSLGEIGMKGFIKNATKPESAKYDLDINLVNFAVGKLIKQDSLLGKITGRVKAKGEGFDFMTMRSNVMADIKKFDFKNYSYNNILIESGFNNGLIESNGKVNDRNVRLFYDVSANLKADYPIINATIDIDTIQMKELGLVDDLFNLSGKVSLSSRSFIPRKLDASMVIDKLIVTNSAGTHPFYATSLTASSSNGIDSIILDAPFAQVRAGGAFDYDKIADAIEQHIARYLKIPGRVVSKNKYRDQDFAFSGFILHDSVYNTLMPGLNYFDSIILSGKFHSAGENPELFLSAKTRHISMVETEIGLFNFNLNTDEKLSANIQIDSLKNENIDFYKTSLTAEAANELLSFHMNTKDRTLIDWFGLSGAIDYDGENYTFSMTDKMLLNYEKWNVNSDNFIRYTPEGIYIHDFNLTSDSSKIYLNSEKDFANSPILVDIDNFSLKNINTFLREDANFCSGILDAKLLISELDKATPAFEGTTDITSLKIKEYAIGDINAKAAMLNDDRISADIMLAGNNNDIKTNIEYFPDDEEKELDAIVYINKLNMNTLEGLSDGTLKNCSGFVKGKINVSGKLDNPYWNGYIGFDTTKFTIAVLGAPYTITNQKIKFKNPTISLDEFIIKDTMNHTLKIDGDVTMLDNDDMGLALDINTYDFILLNAKKTAAASFYGFAAADANLSISGTSNSPFVEGDIYVSDKTDVTVVLPDNGYTKEDANTIVRFVDRDTFLFADHLTGLILEEKAMKVVSTNFNYNVNLEINKNASLRIVVDPTTGDEMLVQGDAQLNAGVDPGGSIFLTGTYELERGYYIQNYQFLKKQFNLVKGSTIMFGGAPMDAIANLSAEYIANTSAQDLLTNEIKDVSPGVANSFKQKYPFRVLLNVAGKLNKPEISFDIQTPKESNMMNSELKSAIENKLMQLRQDPASTNKQVFSLLLLNRFLGEQSADFFKSYTSDFSDIARKSVSRFVSSALNELAGDLLKGIDVDLNLNSYNDFTKGTGEQRTDLNVAISKSFFNNRLTVSVGSNFGLISNSNNSTDNNAVFRPDVTMSYKLSKDGKYLVRAYTKNQFEVVLDGYVIENGLSFMVTTDYDKFKELFSKKK